MAEPRSDRFWPRLSQTLGLDTAASKLRSADAALGARMRANINPSPTDPRVIEKQGQIRGAFGDQLTNAAGAALNLLGGTPFREGYGRMAAFGDQAQAADPEAFASARTRGTVAGAAVPVGMGLKNMLLGGGQLIKDPRLVGKAVNTVTSLPRAAGRLAAPVLKVEAAKGVTGAVANPNSGYNTNQGDRLRRGGEKVASGDYAGAAGEAAGAAWEGGLDLLEAAVPVTRDQLTNAGTRISDAGRNFLGGFNEAPTLPPADQPRAATATAQPAARPRVSTPDQAAAFDRQLAMFGQAPGMAQAAPQAPAALKDDLVASLDGLSIRQVLELAKAMPNPAAAPKPPTADNMAGYDLLNMAREDFAAAQASASTDEERLAARERLRRTLELMTMGGNALMAGMPEQ